MTTTDLKLLKLVTESGNFRGKIAAIFNEMEGAGYFPRIVETFRTLAQQKEKVAKGYSKTLNSDHRAGPDGLARAADIADARYGWGATRAFWLTLGRCALLHDCEWGGLWGLSFLQRRKLKKFLTDRSKPWNPHLWNGPLGWDTAHVGKL